MGWRGDDEILAQLASYAGAGEILILEGWESARLPGGYAGAAVWRLDLRLRAERGDRRTQSFVVKVCRAREVEAMRLAASLGAATFPRIAASRVAAESPDNPEASLFVSPFYAGRDLIFGDGAPVAVMRDLARLHARFERQARPGWSWRIDRTHAARLHASACDALAASARFRATTPDHADLLSRLGAIGPVSPLITEAEDFPPTLVHGDVHPGNFILSAQGDHTLIDWGNACWAPAMIDLANMVPLASPIWAAYLKAYRAAGGATPEPALLRSWRWARGVTALMYLPWVAEFRDDAAAMTAQALEADVALAASGPARLP
jgi:Ser/Thr protein kinase RdoA (MazF antagonist)